MYHQVWHWKILRADYIVFMCFVWLSEEALTFVLCFTNKLVFITEMESVYYAERPESLYKMNTFRPYRLQFTSKQHQRYLIIKAFELLVRKNWQFPTRVFITDNSHWSTLVLVRFEHEGVSDVTISLNGHLTSSVTAWCSFIVSEEVEAAFPIEV
jgi:hypothetical protein